ncbi:hypothetical protein [Gimesia panareensis]|uniref:hypothetical protein n=1 Tax=Gimesia panareensis TaxID=2527978 RepID=UPI00118A8B9B|nr:hypothetical protein [Gimesia panareensis]QDU52118.1 hypothetical protein Pan110_44900 [Gimesia panareensis]
MNRSHYGKLGGPGHTFLAREIERYCETVSLEVTQEYLVFSENKYFGSIDVFVSDGSKHVAIEVEFGPDRVFRDLEKARIAMVNQLIILVPNNTVKKKVQRKLARHNSLNLYPAHFVLSLSQCIQQLTASLSTCKKKEEVKEFRDGSMRT